MSVLHQDGFDHYGDVSHMTDGVWASISQACFLGAPPYGARTGDQALFASGPARRVLGGAKDTVIFSLGVSVEELPTDSLTTIVCLRDVDNNIVATLKIRSDGALILNVQGSDEAQTAGPVVKAATWHHFEMKWGVASVNGTFTLLVDDVNVLTGAALPFSVTSVTQYSLGGERDTTTGTRLWIDDLIVRDTAGTRNNDFEGDLRIATLFPVADATAQGWTPHYRKMFLAGVLDNTAADSCVYAVNATALQIGAAAYTLEGTVRFSELPTGADKAVLFGKWQETGDQREYQLYLGGPALDSGFLTFQISTDGTANTVTKVHSWPWHPDVDTDYHVAVVRTGAGENLLFVDGTQLGVPVADAATYFTGTANFVIGAEMSSSNAIVVNTSAQAWLDEVRFTNGIARYTADFAKPTAAFGRTLTADPDLDSVALLAGFDGVIKDESLFLRPLLVKGTAAALLADDGNGAFETLYQHAPRDDTFIAADLISATGIFQLDAVPANGETVTLGSTTYTFKAALAAANDVLIGATADATLANLTNAIVAGTGSGVTYGAGTVANVDATATQLPTAQMEATAISAGAAGNAVVTTTTAASGQWLQGATLTGGQDIPGASEFTIDRLPVTTTILKSLEIVYRASKSDAGPATMRSSFVDVNGAADVGPDQTLTTSVGYFGDVYDTDPTTGGDLTPLSLLGAKIRVERRT